MRLHTVTITGADDAIDIHQLVDLSMEFPFVEWGILVSKSKGGSPRFPSRSWIDHLDESVRKRRIRVAMHICGKWMRELLTGELRWEDLPSAANFAQTFQFNTHGIQVTPSQDGCLAKLSERRALRTFIFQWNSLAEQLARLAQRKGFSITGLFDNSGGAGILPESGWPSPQNIPFPMGFAGGLGPNNVIEQLEKINAACGDRPIGA